MAGYAKGKKMTPAMMKKAKAVPAVKKAMAKRKAK